MRQIGLRFTIRGLMIAVAVVAGSLALSRSPIGPIIACGLLYLSLIGSLWRMFRCLRRLAALSFGLVRTLSVAWCADLCIYHLNLGGLGLMFSGCFVALPAVLGPGVAWVQAATRPTARARRSPFLAWPLVLVLAVAPLSMLLSPWPLRLAFLLSRPALEGLADRVVAGKTIGRPEWAGLFLVVDAAVDSDTGNVGLITDPDRNGRSGFVRVGPAMPPEHRVGPFHNYNINLPLVGRWSYQNED